MLVDTSDGLAYPLGSEVLVNRLQGLALRTEGISVSRAVIQDAIGIIRTECPQQIPIGYGRTVMDNNGDLCVRTAGGILVIPFGQKGYIFPDSMPRISFLLTNNALEVPYKPIYGMTIGDGDLRSLLNFLNVPETSELLVISWMLSCLIPRARKCALEITGVPRSGKSTLQAILKQILDYSRSPLIKSPPETPRDIHQLAIDEHVISLDGIDSLKPNVQVELVAIMRGKLLKIPGLKKEYKTEIDVSRPVVMNCLESVATLRELADRTISIDLPPIELSNHKVDLYRQAELQAMLPGAYASLIFILGNVAHQWNYQELGKPFPSGLEDFCRIGCSVAEVLGFHHQKFMNQMDKCIKRRYLIELSENSVAFAIHSYIKGVETACQEVSTGQLFSTLEELYPDLTSHEQWPKNERQFGSAVRASIPLLKAHHIDITPLPKRGGLYHIRLATSLHSN